MYCNLVCASIIPQIAPLVCTESMTQSPYPLHSANLEQLQYGCFLWDKYDSWRQGALNRGHRSVSGCSPCSGSAACFAASVTVSPARCQCGTPRTGACWATDTIGSEDLVQLFYDESDPDGGQLKAATGVAAERLWWEWGSESSDLTLVQHGCTSSGWLAGCASELGKRREAVPCPYGENDPNVRPSIDLRESHGHMLTCLQEVIRIRESQSVWGVLLWKEWCKLGGMPIYVGAKRGQRRVHLSPFPKQAIVGREARSSGQALLTAHQDATVSAAGLVGVDRAAPASGQDGSGLLRCDQSSGHLDQILHTGISSDRLLHKQHISNPEPDLFFPNRARCTADRSPSGPYSSLFRDIDPPL